MHDVFFSEIIAEIMEVFMDDFLVYVKGRDGGLEGGE
jgi:hypothetical protein